MAKKQKNSNRKPAKEIRSSWFRVIVVLGTLLCMVSSIGVIQYYRAWAWVPPEILCAEVRDAVRHLKEIELLSDPIVDLLVDLPKIEVYLTEQFKKAAGKEVDFILQVHDMPGEKPPGDATRDPVLVCQSTIFDQFVKGKYDLVGAESYHGDGLTLDDLDNEVLDSLERDGYEVTAEMREKNRAISMRDLPRSGAVRYVYEHPAPSIGIERYSTVNAMMTLIATQNAEVRSGGKYRAQMLLLSRLRSHVAIARILERLDAIKKRRAAMVIGYAHKAELERCRDALGFGGTTINAVPSWAPKDD